LIIVAGICALLASLTLAFILRSRSSLEETNALEADVQARIMLIAACSYVCEASRIGYEPLGPLDPLYPLVDSANPPNSPNHIEAFGWVDVRDGSTGPNTRYNGSAPPSSPIPSTAELTSIPLWDAALTVPTGLPSPLPSMRPKWPAIDSVARCPMYRLARPPFALQLKAVYNDLSQAVPAGMPYLKNPDPEGLPVPPNTVLTQSDYLTINPKDLLPFRPESKNSSWFRVYRDGVTTFVITVGAGGTQGFRDYNEVLAAGPAFAAAFNNEPRFFESLLAQERRMWYRIEWSPAIAAPLNHNILPEVRPARPDPFPNNFSQSMGASGQFALYPLNRSHTARAQTDRQEADLGSHTHTMNQGGTIRWVQRLKNPPKLW
jgi:hypothetical protein